MMTTEDGLRELANRLKVTFEIFDELIPDNFHADIVVVRMKSGKKSFVYSEGYMKLVVNFASKAGIAVKASDVHKAEVEQMIISEDTVRKAIETI